MNLIYETANKEAKPLPDFIGSDSFFVKLTIPGKIIDSRMLTLIKQIDNERLEAMTTDDYVLLGMLFQKQDVVDVSMDRFTNLFELGIIRKTELGIEIVEGKLIVSIDENDDASVSSSVPQALATNAWDTLELNNRHKQILTFMASNAPATITTAQLTNHMELSDGRIRKLLIELAKKNLIRKVGDNRYARYVLNSADE